MSNNFDTYTRAYFIMGLISGVNKFCIPRKPSMVVIKLASVMNGDNFDLPNSAVNEDVLETLISISVAESCYNKKL